MIIVINMAALELRNVNIPCYTTGQNILSLNCLNLIEPRINVYLSSYFKINVHFSHRYLLLVLTGSRSMSIFDKLLLLLLLI